MTSIKNNFVGLKLLQPFFEKLFKISLRGMNYGLGGMTETSGELYAMHLVKKTLRKNDPVIFDVGANHGQYLKHLLRVFNSKCTIYSFEPSRLCIKSLEKFSCNNIFIYNLALSSSIGEMELNYDHEGSVLASVSPIHAGKPNKKFISSDKVNTTTLDQFCKQHNIDHVDFLKIDVEGHEMEVLLGAKKLLRENKIQFIQFEFGPGSLESKIYLKDFVTLLSNYDIYRILKNGIQKITYTERYEIFLTTNYLAILK